MKKAIGSFLVLAVMASLSGCPISVGTGKITGTWQWVEPARLIDPTTVDNYDSDIVAQNFANEGRLRKTLIFTEEKGFSYAEEAFLPDRQALTRGDKGLGVVWMWVNTYSVSGLFTTARYAADGLLAIPGIDTELNVDVDTYTDYYTVSKRDTNGNLVPDTQLRILVEYIPSTSTASAENPLVLRGLLGMNPFDELMVSWAQFIVGKDLGYNQSHLVNVETYTRVPVEE